MKNLKPLLLILFILSVILAQGSCKSSYTRKAQLIDLGEVKGFLYTKVFVRDHKLFVTRDDKGWAAMSTQCTHEGCDLSLQEKNFFCPCCRSYFEHNGQVISSPAEHNLPYYEMSYKEGHLYADTGKPVKPDYRFTTDELEQAIKKLNVEIRDQEIKDVHIPKPLTGELDQDGGAMFREEQPSEVYEREMIK